MKKYQLGRTTFVPLLIITSIFLITLSGALRVRKINVQKLAAHPTNEVAKPIPPPAE